MLRFAQGDSDRPWLVPEKAVPFPRNERTPKADGGRWGPKGDHQTAQGHQAILELSADGSIVPGDSTGVKHGSAYRRRAGNGLSETGTDKPSLQSQAGASEHRTRNGLFRPPGRRSGVSDRGVWVQNKYKVAESGRQYLPPTSKPVSAQASFKRHANAVIGGTFGLCGF